MNTTPSTSSRPQRIPWDDDPRLLAFLPMVYVAWADGVLSEAELDRLRAQVGGLTWLGKVARDALMSWLDPSAPPDPRQLGRVLVEIQRGTVGLASEARRSLAELGQQIASFDMGSEAWLTSETRRALVEIEAALGVVGGEAARELAQVPSPVAPSGDQGARFDVQALRARLEGPYGETRRKVQALLTQPPFERPGEVSKEMHREIVLGWCRALAQARIGALAYPEVLGESADLGEFIAAFEAIAGFDLSLTVKFGVQFGLFGGSIYFLGTESHRATWLPRVASLELPGCFAMTERGHGSNVRDLETVARYDVDKGCFVVHSPTPSSTKEFIGNAAAHGRMATVFAQLEVGDERYGVHALLVPIRDEAGQPLPGVHIQDCGHKIGLNGVDNGLLRFDQVEVPREHLLDRFGSVDESGRYTSPINSPTRRFFTMLGTLVGGRVSVGAGALSAARSGLCIAVRYGARRRQFGPAGKPEVAILDYRTHQRRLMPLLARAYAGTFAFEALTERFVASLGQEDQEVEAMAAALKAWSTWNTSHTLQVCRECCGGAGYMSENRFGALRADTDVFTTFEGDNTVLLQLVAKNLLMTWRQQFNDSRSFAVLKYLAAQAQTALMELNPIVTRQTDTAHLRDPQWQLAAFRYREASLLGSLAQRLKKRIDSGLDAFEAFSDCQDHVLALGRAYAERAVLEPFEKAVAETQAPPQADVLASLRDLFALSAIEADLGWFMEQGYIEPAKARAIRTEVNDLCAEVRAQALHLVEAFGIPDALLGAPIAIDSPGR